MVTANEYQNLAMRTINPNVGDNLANAALGLCGEAGEVADIVKKHLYQGHTFDTEKIVSELGDVLWYVALACHVIGVPMEDVMIHNVCKLKARYPDGFSEDRSVNRDDRN